MLISRAIACNACGSVHASLQRTCKGFRVVRCDDCGLLYVNPMPFFDKSNFHTVSRDFFYTSQQTEIALTKLNAARREFDQQAVEWQRLGRCHRSATTEAPLEGSSEYSSEERPSLIDVGCGPGLFAAAAAEQGWRAEGCDIDERLVSLGRRQFSLHLRHADLTEADFPAETYDVVRFKYVLEHLPQPLEVLKETRRVLRRGGVTMIIVPNEAGAVNQLRVRMGAKGRNRQGTLTPPHHLHAFTPDTLARLLRRAQLEPVHIRTATPGHPAYALYRQAWSIRERMMTPLWKAAQLVGRGSALVAYGRK